MDLLLFFMVAEMKDKLVLCAFKLQHLVDLTYFLCIHRSYTAVVQFEMHVTAIVVFFFLFKSSPGTLPLI